MEKIIEFVKRLASLLCDFSFVSLFGSLFYGLYIVWFRWPECENLLAVFGKMVASFFSILIGGAHLILDILFFLHSIPV